MPPPRRPVEGRVIRAVAAPGDQDASLVLEHAERHRADAQLARHQLPCTRASARSMRLCRSVKTLAGVAESGEVFAPLDQRARGMADAVADALQIHRLAALAVGAEAQQRAHRFVACARCPPCRPVPSSAAGPAPTSPRGLANAILLQPLPARCGEEGAIVIIASQHQAQQPRQLQLEVRGPAGTRWPAPGSC